MDNDNSEFYGPENDIPRPTRSRVYEIIKRLKMNRAPGTDGITGEMLKHGGRVLWDRIYRLILLIWENEKIPEELQTAIVCPIHKKGDKL